VRLEDLQDPFAKAAFTGESGRDGARTPFPWDAAEPMAGFTEANHAWLPLDPAHAVRAASLQEADPDSILGFTRRLVALRAGEPALRLGEARLLDAPAGILALLRSHGASRVLCLVNLHHAPATFTHAGLAQGTVLDSGPAPPISGDHISLPPFSLAFIRL